MEARLQAARRAMEFIEGTARRHAGPLHTKGSKGIPTRLRDLLSPLDRQVPITHATRAALQLDESSREVEHVVPMKRVMIELIDPSKHDDRSGGGRGPSGGGPARDAAHLLELFDQLVVKCWVTPDEHRRLNNAGSSHQWDAPSGDGWERYRRAGIPDDDVLDLGA